MRELATGLAKLASVEDELRHRERWVQPSGVYVTSTGSAPSTYMSASSVAGR